MNSYSQQAVELTEVTINQEVFDFMNINDLVSENTDVPMDMESVIPETKIMCTKRTEDVKEPPPEIVVNLDKESDLVKNSNTSKTIVKKEVNTDDTLANFKALTLNEVIDLWSELSKIPTPECKCRSKKLKKQKK